MVVFTVITGCYDTLRQVVKKNDNWRYVCITDNLNIYPNGWELIHVDELYPPGCLSQVLLQRWVKIYGGPKFFQCLTIYLDGSHEIANDVTELFEHEADIKLKLHPARNCYLDEAIACIRLNKADHQDIRSQIEEYESNGLQPKSGMYETGILIRAWNEKVAKFNEVWWAEVERHTHRDQLSIMWALSQNQLKKEEFANETFQKYIKIHPHIGTT